MNFAEIQNILLTVDNFSSIISVTITKYEKRRRVRTDSVFSISYIRKGAGNTDLRNLESP